MPMSEAAMDGIAANGHGWRKRITIAGTAEIGAMNDAHSDGKPYDRDRLEVIVKGIVASVRAFADCQSSPLSDDLRESAATLECVEDCDIEEINFAMDHLYDDFDFHRILVTAMTHSHKEDK